MYICPTCGKECATEDLVAKHYLVCYKEKHPYHQSKSAPRSEDVNTRTVSDDILSFFNSLKGC